MIAWLEQTSPPFTETQAEIFKALGIDVDRDDRATLILLGLLVALSIGVVIYYS